MPPGITMVGLGPGDPGLITRRAWRALEDAEEVWLRTARHPAAAAVPAARQRSVDDLYERAEDFAQVYRTIVERLLELGARPQGVVYAVPGDPAVGEATLPALRQAGARRLEIVHGVSFVEPCLAALGLDALDGLTLADALDLAARHHPPFPPDTPALIGQLYSRLVAADVKLTLFNQYAEDHPVQLIHAAGTEAAQVESLPMHDLDRAAGIGALTALFVPPRPQASAFESFQQTVARLRAPAGCPWDREQTHESLRGHLLEEAYECLQAIDAGEPAMLAEELGDLLLQIVLQAQIATEGGAFLMADVIAGIQGKIVRRHPHVFGAAQVEGVEQVLHNWEALKAAERGGEGGGLLDGVPAALPALAQAAEIQVRVARVGFDWPDAAGVLAKIAEELAEVQAAPDPATRAGEVGDLLFSVVNYARHLGIDPESALRQANRRFRRRFGRLEAAARTQGRALQVLGPQALDALWEAAKVGEADEGS
jgi:tetrapyrrole methylase family protein/MazG family protein